MNKIDTNKENIEKENREITRLNKQIKLFENNTFIIESVKDPCSICFSDFEGDIAITSCRHIMCGDCIKLLFSNHSSANCPFCRTSIKKKDVNFTHYDKIKGTTCSPVPEEQEIFALQQELHSLREEELTRIHGPIPYFIFLFLNFFCAVIVLPCTIEGKFFFQEYPV